jgi:hypothetical protein
MMPRTFVNGHQADARDRMRTGLCQLERRHFQIIALTRKARQHEETHITDPGAAVRPTAGHSAAW